MVTKSTCRGGHWVADGLDKAKPTEASVSLAGVTRHQHHPEGAHQAEGFLPACDQTTVQTDAAQDCPLPRHNVAWKHQQGACSRFTVSQSTQVHVLSPVQLGLVSTP